VGAGCFSNVRRRLCSGGLLVLFGIGRTGTEVKERTETTESCAFDGWLFGWHGRNGNFCVSRFRARWLGNGRTSHVKNVDGGKVKVF